MYGFKTHFDGLKIKIIFHPIAAYSFLVVVVVVYFDQFAGRNQFI